MTKFGRFLVRRLLYYSGPVREAKVTIQGQKIYPTSFLLMQWMDEEVLELQSHVVLDEMSRAVLVTELIDYAYLIGLLAYKLGSSDSYKISVSFLFSDVSRKTSSRDRAFQAMSLSLDAWAFAQRSRFRPRAHWDSLHLGIYIMCYDVDVSQLHLPDTVQRQLRMIRNYQRIISNL